MRTVRCLTRATPTPIILIGIGGAVRNLGPLADEGGGVRHLGTAFNFFSHPSSRCFPQVTHCLLGSFGASLLLFVCGHLRLNVLIPSCNTFGISLPFLLQRREGVSGLS